MHPLRISSFLPSSGSILLSFIHSLPNVLDSLVTHSSNYIKGSDSISRILSRSFFHICIMRSLSMPSGVSALLVLVHGASALVARGLRTPTPSVSSFLGSATDYPDLGRDGGGGASVNGINVVSGSTRNAPLQS